jgi:malate synthase
MSIEILGPMGDRYEEILDQKALDFLVALDYQFAGHRVTLLDTRRARRARYATGQVPAFRPETAAIREDDSWRVAPPAPGLVDRRVEITGPTDRKMTVNALNSGAAVWLADFEDATSPTWANIIGGQLNLLDAVQRRIDFTDARGKHYALAADDQLATIVVRPRGWHLVEKHIVVDGRAISASLVDFGLYLLHCGQLQVDAGRGPYFYLPKLESHHEARLWNDIFVFAQQYLGLPQGTIRATTLIETITAAFEMDEILYELREHSSGLNAGRWDFIFSVIKNFGHRDDFVLPDRSAVTMTVPFMRAYTELLVRTCHRRGAHAIGGMAAFIPSRRDPEVNQRAMAAVRADKERESSDGFDGTWVAHPDLVPIAREVFDSVLGSAPNQKSRLRHEVKVSARDLIDVTVPDGRVTDAGVRANVSVGLAYLASWLSGNGAAAINNLMEDAATAEISRSQLWQWRVHGVPLDDGQTLTRDHYVRIRDEELATLRSVSPDSPWTDATALLDELVLSDDFAEFLTLDAYSQLA